MNTHSNVFDSQNSSAGRVAAGLHGGVPQPTSGSRRASVVVVALAALLLAQAAHAALTLFPTRIVFERNERSAQVDLMNTGTETATYRIAFEQKRMDENGGFQTVDTPLPDERFSDQMVRYSPRRVVLPPGGEQTVRLLLRKPDGLEAGEYRSHLVFQRIPNTASSAASDEAQASPGEVSIKLSALVGVSIPVIVRHGQTSATVAIQGLELPRGASNETAFFKLDLSRTGNSSVYGDLVAFFTPRGGAERVVSQVNGIAVYAPNALRHVRMALQPDVTFPLGSGTLRVIYRARPEDGGRVLAEATVPVP